MMWIKLVKVALKIVKALLEKKHVKRKKSTEVDISDESREQN